MFNALQKVLPSVRPVKERQVVGLFEQACARVYWDCNVALKIPCHGRYPSTRGPSRSPATVAIQQCLGKANKEDASTAVHEAYMQQDVSACFFERGGGILTRSGSFSIPLLMR